MHNLELSHSATQLSNFQAQLAARRWRGLYFLSGDQHWLKRQALMLCQCLGERLTTNSETTAVSNLWVSRTRSKEQQAIGDTSLQQIQPRQLLEHLGREYDHLVLDVVDGLDANTLCMAAGCVKAGGILFILCPNTGDWREFENKKNNSALYRENEGMSFITRLIGCAQQNSHCAIQLQGQAAYYTRQIDTIPPTLNSMSGGFHPEQQQAVEQIKRTATGHAKRPLVLSADRGRGKSAALGIAVAQLFEQGKQHIIICALRRSHVDSVFKHAHQLLPNAKLYTRRLRWKSATLQFVSSDSLLRSKPDTELLLVDEAAMLPIEQLRRISEHYRRVVFATTLFGYEGSGRGFELRFMEFLRQHYKTVYQQKIIQPIRWNVNDPVEQFCNRLCVLDAELPALNGSTQEGSYSFQRLVFNSQHNSQTQPLEYYRPATEQDLIAVCALMMHAHYRSNPRDMQSLFDDPLLHCWVLRDNNTQSIMALLIGQQEDSIESEITQQIIANKRRLKGLLLKQNILHSSADNNVAALRGLRIMRIVVHPQIQRKGLGKVLLNGVRSELCRLGFQYWGTSFGARAPLVYFWAHCNLKIFKLGHKKQHSSGEYNCLWIEALDTASQALATKLHQQFYRQFFAQLQLQPHYDIDLILALCKSSRAESWPPSKAAMNVEDLDFIKRYIDDQISYEQSFFVLQNLARLLSLNAASVSLSMDDIRLLIRLFILQQQPKEVAMATCWKGRAELEKRLKKILQGQVKDLNYSNDN